MVPSIHIERAGSQLHGPAPAEASDLCRQQRPCVYTCVYRQGLRNSSPAKSPCSSSRGLKSRLQLMTVSGSFGNCTIHINRKVLSFSLLWVLETPSPPGGARSPRAGPLSSGPGNARRAWAGAQLPPAGAAGRAGVAVSVPRLRSLPSTLRSSSLGLLQL